MDHQKHTAYLASAAWRALRNRVLAAAGWQCRLCNRPHSQLQLHHRTYERIGHEEDDDLTVLCPACHEAYHKARGGVDKGPRRGRGHAKKDLGQRRDERRLAQARETAEAVRSVAGEAPAVGEVLARQAEAREQQRQQREAAAAAAQRHADRRAAQARALAATGGR